MMCADLVEVRWKAPGGRTRRTVANLEDISSSGACLQVDIEIPGQSLIQINYAKGEFVGTVRYCHFREIGYFVGVEFQPGCKWSQRRFKPMHMLDPRSLVVKASKETPLKPKPYVN
jgi:hypothetical protein